MSNPTLPSPTPTSTTTFQQPPVLTQIQQKVRRLTRSPSEAQLTTSDLNNYINTFVVYDFPEQLRTFNLHAQFTFFTNPGQDVYPTDIASFAGCTTNPLYNFQNLYISVNPPFYVAGFQTFFSQSREQFFAIWPLLNSISSIGPTGDGVTTQFSGVINTQQAVPPAGSQEVITLLQNNVLFSSIDTNGNGLALADVPVVNTATGNPTIFGNLYDPNSESYQEALVNPPTVVNIGQLLPGTGFINYFNGQFTVNFTNAPADGVLINSQTVPLVEARPQAVLYYQNEFTVRPIPDQPYRVDFEVYQRPVALLANNQSPELEEYWQLISYGASRKILQDRMDLETVQLIEPEFREQMRLCLRRTIKQQTNERVATIYVEQSDNSAGWGWFGNSGGGGTF